MSESTTETAVGVLQCPTVVELLPWLANGSLEGAEANAVRAHLGGCETCREELAQDFELFELFETHVPSRTLAEYACGLAVEPDDRRQLERHLAVCTSCRELLEAIAVDTSWIETETSRRGRRERRRPLRRPATAWRRLAAAAVFAAAVVSGSLLWQLNGREVPAPAAVRDTLSESEPPIAQTGADSFFSDGFESGNVISWSAAVGADVPTAEDSGG